MMSNNEMNRTDLLALERTKLANERTFLAYFRTFIVFLSSGFAILKIEVMNSFIMLGYYFIIIAFLVMLIGVIRFFYVRKKIKTISLI
jgi:putative membrane protein